MEDEEIERIKKKQMEELLQQQNQNKIISETPVIELTSQDFDQEKAKNELLLVDFWAEWCGPCKMLAPVIEKMSSEFDGSLRVYKLNTDENPNTPQSHEITGLPTCIVFKNGQEVSRIVGYRSEDDMKAEISKVIS